MTDKQYKDTAYVFGYFGMPDQSDKANGAGNSLSQLGYALRQLSNAERKAAEGCFQEASSIYDGIYHFPQLIKQSMPESNPTFRTAVDEPVDARTLINYSLSKLKEGMGRLELEIYGNNRKINKTTSRPYDENGCGEGQIAHYSP